MENNYEDSGNIWVKTEEDLDPLGNLTSEREALHIDDIMTSYYDGSESSSISDLVISDVRSNELVLPDIIVSETESSRDNFLERQVETCNERILELEKIVNEQKVEIELLRWQREKCVCRANKVIKKPDSKPIRSCVKNRSTEKSTNILPFSMSDGVKKNEQAKDNTEEVKVCPICGCNLRMFKTAYCRLRHLRNCRDKPIFKCCICNRQWTRRDKLVHHSKTCKIPKQKDNSSNPK